MSDCSTKKCNKLKCAGYMAMSTAITLTTYGLIVNFAPVAITNLFLSPQKVIEGVQYVQKSEFEKQTKKQKKQVEKFIKETPGAVYADKDDGFYGAENAEITIAEFVDYRCGYCKKSNDVLHSVISKEKYMGKVKVVVKSLPILGPVSEYAASNAWAVYKKHPEKFAEIHLKLFATDLKDTAAVDAVFKSAGLTASKDAMSAADSIAYFGKVRELAVKFQLTGTPAFTIGDKFFGGFIDATELETTLDAQLAKSKK